MKSWRSRVSAALAVGAAAIAIPLTAASPAQAAPPSGPGWVTVGAVTYDNLAECLFVEAEAMDKNKYDNVYCDGDGGRDQYVVYLHLR
ncbi:MULTISPECIES: hypothetical protein [Streptomyces]|uniref:hypothetical protein n=1 Tax=Streptomyces lycopersici TaxID=2974589 RepID=UPI0021CE2211|nr:hypothetical protein [Streptomyces sp. NEAU-383]